MSSTAERLLKVISTLCTSEAVQDTIWLRTGTTVCEELADIAAEHGATDEQIGLALRGKHPTAIPGDELSR